MSVSFHQDGIRPKATGATDFGQKPLTLNQKVSFLLLQSLPRHVMECTKVTGSQVQVHRVSSTHGSEHSSHRSHPHESLGEHSTEQMSSPLPAEDADAPLPTSLTPAVQPAGPPATAGLGKGLFKSKMNPCLLPGG